MLFSGHIVPVAETQPITKDKEKTKPQNVVKEKVKVKRPPAAPPNKVSKNPKVQNPHNKPTEEESQKPYAYCEHKIDKPENPKLTNTCQGSKRESYDIVDFNRVPSDDNIASSDAEENFYDIGLQKMSRKQSTKDPDYSTVNLKMGENVTTQPTDANAKGSIEANIEDSGLSIYDDIGEAIAQTTDTVNSEKQHEHKAIGDETKEKKTGNHFEADNNAEDDINKFLYDEVDEKVTDKTFVCNVEQMTDNFDHSATPSVDNDKKSYHHSAEEAENGIPLAQNDDNEGNTDDIVKRSFVSTECTDFWDTEILKDTDSGISGSEVESKDSTMLSSTVINMFYEELQGLDIN